MRIETSSQKTTTALNIRDLKVGIMYWYNGCKDDDHRRIFTPSLNDGSWDGILIDLDEPSMRPHSFKGCCGADFYQVHKSFRVVLVQD